MNDSTRESPRRAVGALLAGKLDDGGYMEYGYRGLKRAQSAFDLSLTVIDQVPPEPARLLHALRELAQSGARLVIAHGGQNDGAAREVADAYPDLQFVVTQGSVHGGNLASYEVRQEQSAFLAGVAAARLSKSGVVGHVSGIRVRPGLLGRAAFAAGVAAANSKVRLLTTFCGTQDDAAVASRVVAAQIAAGADLIFTMLNAALPGAIAACRAHGVRLIGNVRDWGSIHPDVFAGSAMADVGLGVYAACRDWVAGERLSGIKHFGVESAEAVRLNLSPLAPNTLVAELELWRARLAVGTQHLAATYDGAEFSA
ncbi:MAG: BMP family ABC transporter substrate-binding protein [Betaproteobacteria bacterium]|nr:BMP family ABC transporter substrate-binding protein [Betaproteobacteria bacterium]